LKPATGKWFSFSRPYLKKSQHKTRAGGMVQGGDPKFKPQYSKKKKKKRERERD
jgi:cyclophilin family peptidyl-prolyl cis-trans isomerase